MDINPAHLPTANSSTNFPPRMRPILYALGILAFFILSPQWTAYANRGFGFGLSLLLFLPWLDLYITRRRGGLELKWGSICLLALVGWITLVSFWSETSYLPSRAGLQYAALATLVIVLSQAGHPFRYRDCLRCLSYLNLAILFFVLLEAVTGFKAGVIDYYIGTGRLAFTFANPNYFAAVQLLIFVLCLADLAFVQPVLKTDRILAGTGALAALLMIFLSGSRNGILWCGLGSAFFLLRYIRLHRAHFQWKLWHLGLAVAGLSLSVWWAFTSGKNTLAKFQDLFTGGGASEMGRLTIWQVVLDLWASSPPATFFGSGWGALYPLSMNYPSEQLSYHLQAVGFRHAHSEPLELLLEGGMIGLLLLLLLCFWLFKAYRQIEEHSQRKETQALSSALLFLAGFSLFSVATRYTVVLAPAALLLGLLLRHYTPLPFKSRYPVWIVAAVLLVVAICNVVQSGRHFASDLALKEALQAADNESATHYYEEAVAAAPERISPRYDQFIFLCEQGDPTSQMQVREVYEALEQNMPNFKNTGEFYALYQGSIGDFAGAAETLIHLSDLRVFNLSYLADALFYQWVSQDVEGFQASTRKLLYRAFLAETRRRDNVLTNVMFTDASRARIGMELPAVADNTTRAVSISSDTLMERIPLAVRTNQPILRYYVLAEVYRILRDNVETTESPRFLELLSKNDLEKVLRLAQKLDELAVKP